MPSPSWIAAAAVLMSHNLAAVLSQTTPAGMTGFANLGDVQSTLAKRWSPSKHEHHTIRLPEHVTCTWEQRSMVYYFDTIEKLIHGSQPASDQCPNCYQHTMAITGYHHLSAWFMFQMLDNVDNVGQKVSFVSFDLVAELTDNHGVVTKTPTTCVPSENDVVLVTNKSGGQMDRKTIRKDAP